TDGMDGLAGGTSVFAFLSFAFIAAARHYDWLVVFCAAMVGALLAFLWFNVHPAEFIMGDTGALAIGATLAACALTTGFVPLLARHGFVAGFTTRRLGSMAGSVYPETEQDANRAALARRLGFSALARVKQVHGNAVVRADRALEPRPEADALWTDRAGVLLG